MSERDLHLYNVASIQEPVHKDVYPPPPFQLYLIASVLGHPLPKPKLLSLKHVVLTWTTYVLKSEQLFLPKSSVPFSSKHCWIPSFQLSTWVRAGLCNIGQLYEGETLWSFSDLARSSFFQFLQIRHLLNYWEWPGKPAGLSPFHKYLFNWKGYERGLSIIYQSLLDNSGDTKPGYVLKLETELATDFSLSSWSQAALSPLKLSKCAYHIELMRKIHLRGYLTLVRISQTSSGYPRLCWRPVRCYICDGNVRYFYLCGLWWWISCQEILHYPLKRTAELAILDFSSVDFPTHHRTFLHHILIATRLTIAHHWKDGRWKYGHAGRRFITIVTYRSYPDRFFG